MSWVQVPPDPPKKNVLAYNVCIQDVFLFVVLTNCLRHDEDMKHYTLVIIGSGSAGLSAADLASQLGLGGVALVEREHRLGVNACILAVCPARP